jgi:transposase
MIDSTIVRAHQHAAGARKAKGGRMPRALGRSRCGLSTKIHAAGDGLGNPIRLIGTPGQRNDSRRDGYLVRRRPQCRADAPPG